MDGSQLIVDSHTHVDEAEAFGWIDPPESILALMDEAGVDRAAIMTYVDAVDEAPIEYLATAAERHRGRLVPYARLHPAGDRAVDLLDFAVRQRGFKGLKLHPVSNLAHPADNTTLRLVRRAANLGVPVLFHCGDEPYTTPYELEHTAARVPEAAVIFGHMGGYFHAADALEVAARRPNVYLETSAMPHPGMIRRALDALGPERVIFASDGPGCDPRLEVRKVERAGLSDSERQLVFAGNILRLWGEA